MKIYTRTGDSGTTGLYGGPRVSKTDVRIDAYGTVDELNASIGFARSLLAGDATARMDAFLNEIQAHLLVLGADLATPQEAQVEVPRVPASFASEIEDAIDSLEAELPELTNFILPGGSAPGAALHVARTVCRRAERLVAALLEAQVTRQETLIYLNRLSDFLFDAARWVNMREGEQESIWKGA